MPRALKPLIFAVFSAIVFILAFPVTDQGLLAFFALVPLLLGIEGCSPRRAFALGYLFGHLFFLGCIYWVGFVSVPGLFILVAYLALYPAIFALILSLRGALRCREEQAPRRSNLFFFFFIPSFWVTLEFIRTYFLTGFPWALAGYTQYRWTEMIQIANLFGVYGISWLVVAVNTSLFLLIRRRSAWPLLITGVMLAGGWAYGANALKSQATPGPAVAVVQGNIPQTEKWDPAYTEEILDRHERLTREVHAQDTPDIIIWPETSFPAFYPQDPASPRLSDLARSLETPLLVGTPVWGEGTATNSAVLFSKSGEEAGRYDKIHLVPFGEYLPLGTLFSFLRSYDSRIGTFSAGQETVVFDRAPIPFSVLICFEDLFPGLVRQSVKKGARLLVNMTNDAWFHDSSAPHQHLQASVLRAVENGVSLVRAANTGVSAAIDPWGRITRVVHDGVSSKRTFVEGFITARVAHLSPTFYNRAGDLFAWICALIFCVGVAIYGRSPKEKG